MQPHQLEYFLAVAETGSFTRGAQRAGVVQSAVSAAIAQLERQLGAPLIERGYHRIELTAEGEALVAHAREVLAALAAAREAVAGARGDLVGAVMLGTLAYTGPWEVAELLQRFQSRHPRVAVHLRQTFGGTLGLLEHLRSGDLDLSLVSTHADRVPGLTLTELYREPLVFACEGSHPLATAPEVTVTDLCDEQFIDYPTGWGNRTTVDLAFAAAGVTRAIRTEVTDFALARSLVRRGLGVSIVPLSGVSGAHAGPDIAAVPLAEGLEWRVQLARRATGRESLAATRLAEAITAWTGAAR